MTLAPRKESHAMKHVPVSAQDPDRPRSLEELRCRLNRRLSDFREGWRHCNNPHCRRSKQCCGEGPEFRCADDGRPRQTPTPEQSAKAISDLYKELKRRCAERASGVEPTHDETPHKLRDEPRAVTRRRRRRKSALAPAAKTAAAAQQAERVEPAAPVAEQTQLAPAKAEPIDRASNDVAASLPAEQDSKRAPGLRIGPRITML
jgi:hypothetical protein